jgi:hypothetical protein
MGWSRRFNSVVPLLPLAAALVLAGCPDRGGAPAGAERGAPIFEAELRGLEDPAIHGTVRLELGADTFTARVDIVGLDPDAAVTQHVYSWWDCTTIGRIVINLDTLLTVPGEGPPQGEAYPRAGADGRLAFQVSRPTEELAGAILEYRAMLFEELDLGNRTVFLRDEGHRPVACGEIRRSER